MCWSKYEERWLQEEETRRKEEELRRLEAAAEVRAEQMLSPKKEKAQEPVRS